MYGCCCGWVCVMGVGVVLLLGGVVGRRVAPKWEADDGPDHLKIEELVQCRMGYVGTYPKFIKDAVKACMLEINDDCASLCLWIKLDYLEKDANGVVIGYKRENLEKVAKGLYTYPQSRKEKVEDFTVCYDTLKPPPSAFKLSGNCKEAAEFNACYQSRVAISCNPD